MPPGRGSNVPLLPIHCTAFAGSVKNSKTVAGSASMRISRSITCVWLVPASTLPPLLCLRCALELFEAECPEALEELAQLFESLGADPVEAPGPLAPFGHETGLLEYAQVL